MVRNSSSSFGTLCGWLERRQTSVRSPSTAKGGPTAAAALFLAGRGSFHSRKLETVASHDPSSIVAAFGEH